MSFPDLPQPAEALPSLVQGITVFRLAEQKAEHKKVVSFSCPNCGGNKAYSTESNALVCTHCGYEVPPSQTQTPPPTAEIRSAFAMPAVQDKHEFRQEIIEESRTAFVPGNVDISCQNCGVELTIPPQHLSHTCPFCNSHQVIQQKRPENALSPQALIPFAYTHKECVGPVKAWLGEHWLVPKALKEAVTLREFEQVYVPYWAFDARAEADWRAEVGYKEKKSYFENGEWRTRTTTRWKREKGYQEGHVTNMLVSGSLHMDQGLLKKLDRFQPEGLKPYTPAYLAGVAAQAYDVPLEEAWAKGRTRIRERMKDACTKHAFSNGGHSVRNLNLKMELEEETWKYILLPFLVSSFEYDGRQYQVLVNGQTGDLEGYRPIDWKKFYLLGILAFLPALIALLTAFWVENPDESFLAGFGLAIAAGIGLVALHSSAKKVQG